MESALIPCGRMMGRVGFVCVFRARCVFPDKIWASFSWNLRRWMRESRDFFGMRLSQSRVSPWEGAAAPCHPSRDPSVPGSRAWCFRREDIHHSGMIHHSRMIHHSGMIHYPGRRSGVRAGNGIQTHRREYKPFSRCCHSLPGLDGRASPAESPSSSQGWE